MLSRSHAVRAPVWSTSSFGGAGDDSPASDAGLVEHLRRCRGAEGRWHPVKVAADAVDGIVAGRLVTTIAIASVFIGVTAWLG